MKLNIISFRSGSTKRRKSVSKEKKSKVSRALSNTKRSNIKSRKIPQNEAEKLIEKFNLPTNFFSTKEDHINLFMRHQTKDKQHGHKFDISGELNLSDFYSDHLDDHQIKTVLSRISKFLYWRSSENQSLDPQQWKKNLNRHSKTKIHREMTFPQSEINQRAVHHVAHCNDKDDDKKSRSSVQSQGLIDVMKNVWKRLDGINQSNERDISSDKVQKRSVRPNSGLMKSRSSSFQHHRRRLPLNPVIPI